MNSKKNRGLVLYIVILVLLLFGFYWIFRLYQEAQTPKIVYSDVISYFDNYQVKEYTLDLGTGELRLIDVEGKSSNELPIIYKVPNVTVFLSDIQTGDNHYRIEYNKRHPNEPLKQDFYPIKDNSFLISMITPILLLVVMIVIFYFTMKQAGGGGKISNFGKANVKPENVNKKTTFADVAGADEEKTEMEEIVDFLKNPKKYREIGARIPKGVLLLGPPGTGKTLMARAVAGEANVPFFLISGSDFVEMFVGVGASRVRDLFDTAKKHSPSIIFIDEIDAVGRQRGTGLGGGHDEREQTLNQLLVEMDGFTENENVIVMAATNRRDVLDPALLRPGRFDRQIYIGYPDVKGREAILKVHTKNKPLAPDVDLSTIAKTTAGFTGADLENIVNEASLLAARANRKAITEKDIEDATIKVIAGPEKRSKVVTEKERKLTSYHEAGHAVCTYYCPTQDKVHQVSIIPRGMAGGFTLSLPEHDKSFVSKTEMKENIITLLGGRVAEKLILDDISTGASNDIERATSTARSMVTKYGFSDKLGPIVYGHDQQEVFLGRDFSSTPNYSENVAAEIDAEIREIIEDAYEKAKDILSEHINQLHMIAKHLMKYEKIDSDDFEKLMAGEMTPEEFNARQEEEDRKEREKEEKATGKIIDVTVDENTEISSVPENTSFEQSESSNASENTEANNDTDDDQTL